MTITIPLPSELTSVFVVAVERLPFAVETVLPWRMGRPHRRAALEAMGTPLLTVTPVRSPWKPGGITLTDDERRRLRKSRHHVLISSTAPPHAQPSSAQMARAAARALADECDGLVIDPTAGTTVFSCAGCPGERAEFRLGDDWLGWEVDIHDDATCPPWDPATTRTCTCLRVTSRGLSRFALPEITLDGAACAHNLCAITLLRTVAQRLIADHLTYLAAYPGATTRTIHNELRVEGSDQALFWGDPDDGRTPPLTVHLTPCPPTPKGGQPTPRLSRLRRTSPRATAPANLRALSPRHGPASNTTSGSRAPSPRHDGASDTTFGSRTLSPRHEAAPDTTSRSPAPSPRHDGASDTSTRSRGSTHPHVPTAGPNAITCLRVSPAPGADAVTCLKVGPPSTFTGTLNDWLCATQGASFATPPPTPASTCAGDSLAA